MTIQELERQLLTLDESDRQRIAQLLTQSLKPSPSLSDLPIGSNDSAWNDALQKLARPSHCTRRSPSIMGRRKR
jgi:hypothetical protein